MRKFRQESNLDLTNVASTSTWVELRLAEVLLNLAEAEMRLGHYDVAMGHIAKIRSRVGLPTDTTLTGDAAFEALIHERKIELAYEGHLWWDMRRWRLSEEAYTGYRTHGLKITKEGSGYRYQYVDVDGQDRKFLNRMYRLPIPDAELQNNNAIEQFPEWNF
ncbi:MAG: RagB/SusD family nutrient uptake outer membrane protein [Alistipes sp.]|nr:RagB/SusD family nutrient uptake outer membrane protein [Alistipes sp.]